MAKDQIAPARPQQNPPQAVPQPKLRPASQEEVDAAKAKGEIRDFGNMEFGMELQASGSFDPVSKLGFMQDQGNKSYSRDTLGENRAMLWGGDEVLVGSGRNTPAVWNHEYRHKGFKLIEDTFRNLTTEELKDRWGGAGILAHEYYTARFREEESLVEMFDRPEDHASPSGDYLMENTFDHPRLEDDRSTQRRSDLVQIMSDLALDILKEQGSPDPAKRKEAEGFFKSLLNSFFGGNN